MKIVTVIGARPQFIKAAVVSRAIKNHNQVHGDSSVKIKEVIVHTGQHYDRNMSAVFFEEMQIPEPDYRFDIHGLSHGAMTGQMLEKIEAVLIDEKPEVVLVYGDTNTTLAGALAAVKLHIPLAHVEAGLRAFNRKMPEEINRLLADHVSSLLFCPTRQAVQNLANEGIGEGSSSDQKRDHSSAQLSEGDPSPNTKNLTSYEPKSSIFSESAIATDPSSPNQPMSLSALSYKMTPKVEMVGDVMLDAALFYIKYARKPEFDPPDRFILGTIHRAENTDSPDRLQSIFKGLEKIGSEIPIVLPLHPRTQKKIIDYNLKISNPLIMITDPVGYLEMIYLLQSCSSVVTDSGGLQKEAFFFKKPCITLREETEWVELVEHGFNQLSGAAARTIYGAYKNAFASTNNFNIELYGDGKAGDKIVDFLIRDCWS